MRNILKIKILIMYGDEDDLFDEASQGILSE